MTDSNDHATHVENGTTVAPKQPPTGYFPEVRHPGSLWIQAHLDDLPHNEYVAASKDGLLAHDVSARAVLATVEALVAQNKVERLDVIIEFIPAPRTSMPPQWGLHPGKLWIDEHLADLPCNQWVAASKDGLIAQDVAAKVVQAQIQDLAAQGKVDPLDVFMALIEPGYPSKS